MIDKRTLYLLMVSQLKDDGFEHAARLVADIANLPIEDATDRVPLQRLETLVTHGLEHEKTLGIERPTIYTGQTVKRDRDEASDEEESVSDDTPLQDPVPGIDLDTGGEPSASEYVVTGTIQHGHMMLCSAVSHAMIATGGIDGSVQVHALSKIKGNRPKTVVRTFREHKERVNDIAFDPFSARVVSASDDGTMRLFNVVDGGRSSEKVFGDITRVMSVDFHPSGDFLLAGTAGPAVRLIDIETGAFYKAREDRAQHKSGVYSARFAPTGKVYATAGVDGDVKVWDGVKQSLVHVLPRVHSGMPAVSARFSKSGQYLLTTGLQGIVMLFDVRKMRRPLLTLGMEQGSRRGDGTQLAGLSRMANVPVLRGAVFSADETHVILPSAVYSTKDGRLLNQLRGYHSSSLHVSSSAFEPLFVTSGDVGKVWTLDHKK